MMNSKEIDLKLFNSAMNLAAEHGWNQLSLVEAAQQAEIPPQTARQHFPCKASLLVYLNRLADEAALTQTYQEQPVSDYLFDLMMSRFDVLQDYRKGVISALHTLPYNPPLAVMMGIATKNSMRWIAESAQINTYGIKGIICIKGLVAIWAVNMRVWAKDETQDLSETMASLDQTIKKAGKFSPYFVTRQKNSESEINTKNKDEPYNSDSEI